MLAGKKLQFIRIYKGISQKEIAKRIGITPQYISIMENERQDIPDDIYEKWIRALYNEIVQESRDSGIENDLNNMKTEVNETTTEIKNRRKKSK